MSIELASDLDGYELVETFMPYYSERCSQELRDAIVGYDLEDDPLGVFHMASADRCFVLIEPSGHERDSSMDLVHLYRQIDVPT